MEEPDSGSALTQREMFTRTANCIWRKLRRHFLVRRSVYLSGAGNGTFVFGDNRLISQDSRSTVVGCIADEQIVGKIVFRVWPLDRFGEIR